MYQLLIRSATLRSPRIASDTWNKLWSRFTPRFEGETSLTLHGQDVVLNAGYAYPAFSRRWPTYNDPLVEIVHQTSADLGRRVSVVDVGAAIGDTVLLLMERCPGDISQFYCVEPDLEFFGYLERNLGNRADVELFCEMLSDSHDVQQDMVRIHSGTASAQGERTRAAVPLDSVLAHAATVDVLKIDTDGFDGQILAGATQLLTTHQPSVIFEWHPVLLEATGHAWAQPFEVLVSHGYRWFVWFTKEGEFSHVSDGFDSQATEILAQLSLSEQAPRPDWHYDVVALRADKGPRPGDVAALGFAKQSHHRS